MNARAVRGGQRRLVLVLAAVLGLNSADLGMIGAIAPQLERSFRLSATQLGLLATVASGLGAAACVPMGWLADRAHRVRLLTMAVLVWAAALVLGGAAPSYRWLLASRLLLGAASAATGPVLASLIGDLFPAERRTEIYSRLLAGELVGAGVALVAGSTIASLLSWRWALWLLAAVAVAVALAVARVLDEPARSGGGARDPGSVWAGFRYVFASPTLRLLVVASTVGYFFFAGLRTFALTFARRQYDLPVATTLAVLVVVGIGALAGVLAAGAVTDRVQQRVPAARIVVPGVAYAGTAIVLLPALLVGLVWVALPLLALGAALLGAANPPLDAARLDLAPAGLWGRAETARTVLRLAGEAAAPVSFGAVADTFAGRAGGAGGLQGAFLVMLVPLLANAWIMLYARRTYPADVDAVHSPTAPSMASRKRSA